MNKSTDDAESKGNRATTKQNALAIFGVLLIIYLITFNGQFTSIDELNLYAMAESLVQMGNTAVPQVSFASYHNPVGSHEIGFPLIATPLYWLAIRSQIMNNIYFVMLLNPLLVAATSAFIFLSARKLDYSSKGSAIAAFAYGLGSLGWPYALGFYREPLVGFLWTVGIFGLLSWRVSGSKWWGGIGILFILLSPLVKVNILFSLPFLFLAALKSKPVWKKRTYIIVVVAIVILFVLFQLLVFLRSGSGWNFLQILTEATPFLIASRIYGQLFSPIKGLIFYMPVFILAILGLYFLYRRYQFVALGIGLAFLSLVVVLSFYGAWFGGQSWGPRMLVPIIPILLIPIASLWDGVQKRYGRILILVVLLFSIVLQLPVVTSNWWSGYAPFYKLSPTPEESVGLSFSNLALSPPWVLLRNWVPTDLNLLWLQTDRDGVWHVDMKIGILLVACLLCLFLLWKFKRTQKFWVLFLLPIVTAVLSLQLLGGDISVGYPGLTEETGRNIVASAAFADAEPYTLVMMSNEFHIYFYEGFLKGDFIHHWLSPNQMDEFESILQSNKGRWLSLVVDRVHIEPGITGKDLEWWLNEQFYRIGDDWFEGYEFVRYAILPEDNWSWQSSDIEFGPFQIEEFALQSTQYSSDDVLGVQLQVCNTDKIPAEYRMFVHLLGPAGTVEGLDGPIRYGGIAGQEWQTGDCYAEKRAVYIPPEAQSGTYQLIVGAYTPDGPILPANSADDSVTFQLLTTIDVLKDQE